MNGIKLAAAVAAGYLGYHVIHTPQGRQLAKDTLKLVIEKSGQAEDAITRSILKALDDTPKTEQAESAVESEVVEHEDEFAPVDMGECEMEEPVSPVVQPKGVTV